MSSLQQSQLQSNKHPDGRSVLSTEEMISEDEARRRREQLNRRPSYRMILKDLETVGEKPLKKEMDDNGGPNLNDTRAQPSATGLTLINPIDGTSPYGSPLSNGGGPSMLRSPNNSSNMLINTSSGRLNMIPPSQPANNARMLASPQSTASSMVGEIPSQPQPQLPCSVSAGSPMLSVSAAVAAAANLAAANSLSLPLTQDILNLKAAGQDGLMGGFAQNNDWQTSLLNSYQNNNNHNANHGLVGPAMGLGNRQGSASLTSLSDNGDNDGNRKRQVRLLKNREAAKECRRKKKEYVKCLENRVAVLENQNKALIEELKTLKELYCRKEKSELT
ncbi:bZIP transcription factor domain-containing protein [Ditylenchus destructor]|nr:bZIP transcription factor domain-containing protein [Ditylenchus destructor]